MLYIYIVKSQPLTFFLFSRRHIFLIRFIATLNSIRKTVKVKFEYTIQIRKRMFKFHSTYSSYLMLLGFISIRIMDHIKARNAAFEIEMICGLKKII